MNNLEKNQIQFNQIIEEAKNLRWEKYKCYGDSYKDFGLIGIAIKINDKCKRIINITKNPHLNDIIKNDSLRDSLIDLINYSVMYVMELDNINKKGDYSNVNN